MRKFKWLIIQMSFPKPPSLINIAEITTNNSRLHYSTEPLTQFDITNNLLGHSDPVQLPYQPKKLIISFQFMYPHLLQVCPSPANIHSNPAGTIGHWEL